MGKIPKTNVNNPAGFPTMASKPCMDGIFVYTVRQWHIFYEYGTEPHMTRNYHDVP